MATNLLSFPSSSLRIPCPQKTFRSLPPTTTSLGEWIRPRRLNLSVSAASDSSNSSTSLSVVKSVKSAWERPEERIGLAGLGISFIIAFWAAINTLTAVDKVPLLSTLFELIGIWYTWWFVYRYLIFKPNRKELADIINAAISAVLGN